MLKMKTALSMYSGNVDKKPSMKVNRVGQKFDTKKNRYKVAPFTITRHTGLATYPGNINL